MTASNKDANYKDDDYDSNTFRICEIAYATEIATHICFGTTLFFIFARPKEVLAICRGNILLL